MRKESIYEVGGVGGPFGSRSDSFDAGCELRLREASTFVEKAICTDKQLSSLDDQLAGLYKAARAANVNAATVEADQKVWLSSRDQCIDAACLKKAYADRIAVLSGSSAAPASGGFTGTYKMKNGEALV